MELLQLSDKQLGWWFGGGAHASGATGPADNGCSRPVECGGMGNALSNACDRCLEEANRGGSPLQGGSTGYHQHSPRHSLHNVDPAAMSTRGEPRIDPAAWSARYAGARDMGEKKRCLVEIAHQVRVLYAGAALAVVRVASDGWSRWRADRGYTSGRQLHMPE